MASPLNLYMTYSFLRILTQPWEDTEAFKLGIIDAEGNILKTSRELHTTTERNAYTIWHRLIWKLKRILDKIPFGKTLIGSYIAALYLIKENVKNKGNFDELLNEFCKLKGIDSSLLIESANSEETIEPGNYIVISEFLDGIFKNEIITIDETLKPVDSMLGENIYMYDGSPFTKSDIFPISEDAVVTAGVAGVAAGEEPPGPSKKLIRRTKFAGMEVFECDDDVYHRCRLGKKKYHRYDKYVGDDEAGQEIRNYGLKNPKAPIIVKHNKTGHMMYLRHPTPKYVEW